MNDKQTVIKSIIGAALAFAAVRLFGPLPTMIGYGAGYLVYKQLRKSHPGDNMPLIVGIVVGIVVALAAGIGFAILLLRME